MQMNPADTVFLYLQVALPASAYFEAGSEALFSLSGLASYNLDDYGNGSGG